MRIGVTSRIAGRPEATLDDLVGEVQQAERDGYAFFSLPNIFGHDAIGALTVVGRETERIELATGVVPAQPRHPVAMAQQALTAQAAAGGRFVLGIGLSHKIVIEDMMGLSFARPAKTMEAYLEVLAPLLRGEKAEVRNDLYRVNLALQVAGGTPVPLVVAALGPRMLRVAGRLADGTATWMTGRRTLAEHTVPVLREAAREAGRPEPRVVAALPVAITNRPDAARDAANQAFAIYGQLPSYRAMLDREGAAGPGDVALLGDEKTVRDGLAALRDAGVTHFAASLYPAEEGAVARTAEFLRGEL